MRGEPSVHTVSSLPQNVFEASKFRERSLREGVKYVPIVLWFDGFKLFLYDELIIVLEYNLSLPRR